VSHEQFQELLDRLVRRSAVGQHVLGEVMARVSLQAPLETTRMAIAAGNPAGGRAADQREIPQATVSKAVKALIEEGLLEDGETLIRSTDAGRPLSPLRLGSRYATAGVKVIQEREQPARVTTALVGLDSQRLFGVAHDPARDWDKVAGLIRRHVTSLKDAADRRRASAGLPALQLLGIGAEVGAPVHDGQVMPLSRQCPRHPPVPLAEKLHRLLETDPDLGRPVPVMVENDVNALAVLAIHEVHYTDPDLVVVAVYDEGVGGGLVMDGRLRRGGTGRAMEIGHLAIGFPPGQDPERGLDGPGPGAAAAMARARCSCGQLGHVDSLATPVRITEALGGGTLEQASEIRDAPGAGFGRAREVFAGAGAALGRALAHVSNTVNPNRVVLYLPPALAAAEDRPWTAGSAYLAAMKAEVARAFAASDEPGYLRVRAFPADPRDAALLGARAAAVCVLEGFIEHALRLDGCRPVLRRGSPDPGV
jgi:predicted NBD/HSP70 family sugar kinase